jgi:hypothetical protein
MEVFMTKKEKKISEALKTDEGRDKLGMSIAKGLFDISSKPGPYQVLAQAAIDAFKKK